MPDLDAAIHERLESYGDDPCGYATCIVVGFAEIRAALIAVLDEHKPHFERYGYAAGGQLTCSGETRVYGDMNDYTDYPCDTVLAIAKALGMEAP